MDKKRSSDVKEQLGIFNINEKLTQCKINWREHIQIMNDILNYKPEGSRNIGRSLTRWEERKSISGRQEQAKGHKPYS